MANRYWVGGSGNWSDNTNHWSASSGGSPGASAPGSSDDCIFDSNSAAFGFTVTVDTTVTVISLDWSGVSIYSKTFARSSGVIHVTGNVTFHSTVTVAALSFDFSTGAAATSLLHMNGATMSGIGAFNINVNATGTVKLASNFNKTGLSNFTLTNGIFDTDGYNVTAPTLLINANPTVYFRASTIAVVIALNVNSSATLDTGTSTIQATANGTQLTLGSHDYYRIEILSGSLANPVDILDALSGRTIDTLYLDPGSALGIKTNTLSTAETCTNLDAQGTSGNHINILGVSGTAYLCAENPTVSFVDTTDIIAACGSPYEDWIGGVVGAFLLNLL